MKSYFICSLCGGIVPSDKKEWHYFFIKVNPTDDRKRELVVKKFVAIERCPYIRKRNNIGYK